jgi:hypothetical protein
VNWNAQYAILPNRILILPYRIVFIESFPKFPTHSSKTSQQSLFRLLCQEDASTPEFFKSVNSSSF